MTTALIVPPLYILGHTKIIPRTSLQNIQTLVPVACSYEHWWDNREKVAVLDKNILSKIRSRHHDTITIKIQFQKILGHVQYGDFLYLSIENALSEHVAFAELDERARNYSADEQQYLVIFLEKYLGSFDFMLGASIKKHYDAYVQMQAPFFDGVSYDFSCEIHKFLLEQTRYDETQRQKQAVDFFLKASKWNDPYIFLLIIYTLGKNSPVTQALPLASKLKNINAQRNNLLINIWKSINNVAADMSIYKSALALKKEMDIPVALMTDDSNLRCIIEEANSL